MTGRKKDTMTDGAGDAAGTGPRPLFYSAARLFLGAVFIYASIDKILHPLAFAQAVYNYQILPVSMVNIFALALPWLELVIGLALVSNRWMPGATLISSLLFASFIAALAYNEVRGLNVHCGCFTTDPAAGAANWWTAARDLFFLAVSAYLLLATLLGYSTTNGAE